MIHFNLARALSVVFLLSSWTIGETKECGNLEYPFKELCCNKCPQGTFLKGFCSKTQGTICSPCPEGTYAEKDNAFDRCEPCPTCQHGLAEGCTKTTSGNCSCLPGFLCSDKLCSRCEENKCGAGERPKRIDYGLIYYSYQCEPRCAENQYFDEKQDTCKTRTQCSEHRLDEIMKGNKTHNSICAKPETQKADGDYLHWIMSLCFVLLSLTFFMFVFNTCLKKLRRSRKNNAARKIPVQTVTPKTSDFHLSKEESGFKLIIQDEFEDCICVSQPDDTKEENEGSV